MSKINCTEILQLCSPQKLMPVRGSGGNHNVGLNKMCNALKDCIKALTPTASSTSLVPTTEDNYMLNNSSDIGSPVLPTTPCFGNPHCNQPGGPGGFWSNPLVWIVVVVAATCVIAGSVLLRYLGDNDSARDAHNYTPAVSKKSVKKLLKLDKDMEQGSTSKDLASVEDGDKEGLMPKDVAPIKDAVEYLDDYTNMSQQVIVQIETQPSGVNDVSVDNIAA